MSENTALAKLASMLDAQRENLLKVLPTNLSVDRVRAIALSAASRNPKLLACTAESFYVALHTSVSLGLEPNTPLQHAWLIPYKDQATFQLGYKGLIELCRRSGQIQNIYAYPARDGDEFEYSLGLRPDIKHTPRSGPDKPMTHVYAVAHLKDGGEQFVVMTHAEVESIRLRSKSPNEGPWKTDYEAMAQKTALKRLTKCLPQSIELATAIERDNESEFPPLKDVTPRDERPALVKVRERLKPPVPPAAPQEQEKRAKGKAPAKPETPSEPGELEYDEEDIPTQ